MKDKYKQILEEIKNTGGITNSFYIKTVMSLDLNLKEDRFAKSILDVYVLSTFNNHSYSVISTLEYFFEEQYKIYFEDNWDI